jgi:fucose permease
MGFAAAPVFPLLIATTPGRLGALHTANGVGLQIAAAMLGAALLPALLGILAHRLGLEVIGPGLFVVALLLLTLYEALMAQSTKILPQASGTT